MFATLFKRPPSIPDADGRVPKRPPSVSGKPPVPLYEFAAWLVQSGETSGIPGSRLQILYGEFCEYTCSDPLTEGQLFKRLRAAGIERYRETVGDRRYFYRISTADVIGFPRARRVA